MKSKVKPYICILIIFIALFICIKIFTRSKEFDNLIGTNEGNVTKVVLTSGNTGDHVIITDSAKIKQFANLVNNRYYSCSLDQLTNRSGWGYKAEIYKGSTLLITMIYTGGNIAFINCTHYHVDKIISMRDMDDLFKSLPLIKF